MYINGKNVTIKYLSRHVEKFVGLMFKKEINYGVKIRCNGIHTFFMFNNIDIVLTDRNNIVLYIYKNVPANRIILPRKKVYYTYELPVGTITDLKTNERL